MKTDAAENRQNHQHDQAILQAAERLFAAGADWINFYSEVLGGRGIVRQFYPSEEDLLAFEKSDLYAELQQMLRRLRERKDKRPKRSKKTAEEPEAVITVRLPASLHAALTAEAELHSTSMNKLCISKLLQIIDTEFVPEDHSAAQAQRTRRARRAERAQADTAPQPAAVSDAPSNDDAPTDAAR